ncbi:USP6 N-terminal-like protein isoform X2 [Mustela lutreola]|uniref:USP6 N-terminal-like protein isoform X2 n=1 Tax=Mustela lutreola TaxID=9666 RepID=UPI002796ED2B|nr:USP6 N-terminal-like protein isoform X2 [Mustela lutreola]
MHGFFAPGFPKLARFQRHHDSIMEKELRGLRKHLASRRSPEALPSRPGAGDEQGLSAGLYTTKWFLQCFIGRTPFVLTLTLWDAYMLDGACVLTAMAYTVLRLHRSTGPRGSPGVPHAGVGGQGDGPLLPGARSRQASVEGHWLAGGLGAPLQRSSGHGASPAGSARGAPGNSGTPNRCPGQDPGTVGRRPSALTHTHCPERLLKLPLEGLQGFLQDTLAQPWALEDEAVLGHLRASMAHLHRRKCDLPPPGGGQRHQSAGLQRSPGSHGALAEARQTMSGPCPGTPTLLRSAS